MLRRIRGSLRVKWMAFSVLLATIPLGIAGFSLIRTYQENLRKSVIEVETEKARLVVEKTRAFFEKVTSNLLFITKDTHYQQSDYSQIKEHFKKLLNQNDYLTELTLLNERGWEVVKVSKFRDEGSAERKDRSRTEMFRVASKGRVYHGDFRILQEVIPTIIVAVPVVRDPGKPPGVLIAQIHLQSVWDVVTGIRIGQRGFAYVVDHEGTLVSHPDTHRVLMQINMRHFPMVDQVVAGKEGNLEFEHPRGEKFLFVFKPIEELDWGVVVQVPVEEAYQPIQAVTRTALVWICLSLSVAMIFSLLFTRKLIHPIKRLSSEMTKVSKGNLNVHIEPTRPDEIGLLADSFNRMVEDLRKSQEALVDAERKYRRIFENSKDMIYITSVGGKFLDVNQAGVEMLGYTNKKELMNIHIKDIYLHLEDRKKFQSEITQKGFVKDFEVKLKRKDGTPMDCLITANIRQEEEGVITGYEGIIKDISFRKNAEKELLQKTEQLQTLYDLSVLINQTLDLKEVLPIALDRATHLTRFEMGGIYLFREEEGVLELKHYRGYSADFAEKVKALKLGEGVAGQAALLKEPIVRSIHEYPSSQLLPFLKEIGIQSLVGIPLLAKGKAIGAITLSSRSLHHLTQREIHLLESIGIQIGLALENALLLDEIKASEERYRTVVESAHDGVAVIGDDYRVEYCNERLAEILGYSRGELIGMDLRHCLDEESQQLVSDRYLRRQRGEEVPPRYEFDVLRKDGENRHVESSSTIVRDSKGRVNTVSYLKDITEKRRMEEQLLQSEKLRALGEMATGVAHDFNNALTAILGNAQLLLYTAKDEDSKETLRTIEKVAKDSAQTVRRLQDFTRKNAHKEIFRLDVNSIIREAMEITRPKWKDDVQRRGFQIEMVSILEEIPLVGGHTSELREVITNMIFNAIEAMPEGGKIEIRTYRRKEDVCIRIADTGVGMTEEVRKKAFEPFFTTKPFTNTGLGLSMSYGIVKRLGGDIEVESKVGQGTTFTILLPVRGEGKDEWVMPTITRRAKEARILVIDDEESVRSVLSRILSQVNHQVTVAKDGGEGLQLFQEKEFDIVLTDLGMPGMSGWDVCKAIKKLRARIPVGMITGWGMELDQTKKEESGLDFVIPKPFDFHQIIKVVDETMESSEKRLLS